MFHDHFVMTVLCGPIFKTPTLGLNQPEKYKHVTFTISAVFSKLLEFIIIHQSDISDSVSVDNYFIV